MNKKKLQQAIESQTKAKGKITWRRQVLDPLSKGNGSTHPRQTYAQGKSTKHQPKLGNHKCKLPLNQCNSPWTNACKPPHETEQLHPLSSHRSDRSPSPVRPVYKIAHHLRTTPVRPVPLTGQADATWETAWAQKEIKTTWKPSKCVQQAISSSNLSPLLTMHESSQKCQKSQPRAS
jgi:hypothetical protein